MSEKSIPYYDFVKKLFNRSGDLSKDFAHAILGVVTEVHEYLSATDEVNGLEELGDLAFYLVALSQVAEEYVGGDFVQPDLSEGVLELIAQAHEHGAAAITADVCNTLLDEAKRWVGYGKPPKSITEACRTCAELIQFVNLTGPFPCTDDDRIKLVNMKKLLKRYPGGEFSHYHAVVRDLEGERVVLQTA